MPTFSRSIFIFTALFFVTQLTAQTSSFYDLPPAPAYIQERMGPFGPQQKNYPVPVGAIVCAPDGLVENSGASIDKPTTLANAVALAATGGTVVLRGGTYRTGNIVFRKQITIQPYLAEKPILKGSKVASDWTPSGSHWKTSWSTLFFKSQEGLSKIMQFPPSKQHQWNKDMVFINGMISTAVASIDKVGPGKFYVDYTKSEVCIGDDPSGKTVEITAYEKGLVREHFDPITNAAYADADSQGPTIQGLVLMQYAGHLIQVQGRDVYAPIEPGAMPIGPVGTRILNNSILFSGSTCMSLTGTPETTIAYNDISYGHHEGVTIRQAHNSVFEHNIVSFHNRNDIGYYPAGIKIFNQCLNFVVRNNYYYGTKGNAVWYDVGHRDGVVVNNYFKNNAHCAKTEISYRIYFAGNVLDQSPLWIVNVCDNMVYNNTFIDSKLTVKRNDRGVKPDGRASFNHNATGPGPSGYNGQEIANNVFIFSDSGNKGAYLELDDTNSVDTTAQTRLIAHNLFSGKPSTFAKAKSIYMKVGSIDEFVEYAGLSDLLVTFGDQVRDCVQIDKSLEELFNTPSIGDYRLRSMPGLPTGVRVPESVAKHLKWKPVACGVGAFAQYPEN